MKNANQKGQLALLSLLIIGAITMAAALSASFIGRTELGKGFRRSQLQEALVLADSCTEEALRRLKSDPQFQEAAINFEDEKCQVAVFYEAADKIVLYTTSQVGKVVKKLETHITRSGGNLIITDQKEMPDSAWFQTKWDEASAATASHYGGGQNDWTKYSSKNENTELANGGNDLQAGQVEVDWLQTNDTLNQTGYKFPGYSESNTEVSGSGSGASVKLERDTSSGTGADGPLDLSVGCSRPDSSLVWQAPSCIIYTNIRSTFNFTTINIPAGTTLTASGSGKIILYVTGTVTIDGTINLNASGQTAIAGGGSGGNKGLRSPCTSPTAGQGVGPNGIGGGNRGGGGFGAAGTGAGGSAYPSVNPTTDVFYGGSGGGGGSADCGGDRTENGGSGGGGGGAIRIASGNSITIGSTGSIQTNGAGGGAQGNSGGSGIAGAGGAGGGILLQAQNSIANSGSIQAKGGAQGSNGNGHGGGGRVRLETPTGANITGAAVVVSSCANASGTINVCGGSTNAGTGSSGAYSYIAYFPTGTFISGIFNTGQGTDFTTVHWNLPDANQPANTSLKVLIAASKCPDGKTNPPDCNDSGDWVYKGINGTSPANDDDVFSGVFADTYQNCTQANPCTIHSGHDGDQYIRYKVYLKTTDSSVTPSLDDISIKYKYYLTEDKSIIDYASAPDYLCEGSSCPSANATVINDVAKLKGTPSGTPPELVGTESGLQALYHLNTDEGKELNGPDDAGVDDAEISDAVGLWHLNEANGNMTLSDSKGTNDGVMGANNDNFDNGFTGSAFTGATGIYNNNGQGTATVTPQSGKIQFQVSATSGGTAGQYNSAQIRNTTSLAHLAGNFDRSIDYNLPNGLISSSLYNVYVRYQVDFGASNRMLIEQYRTSTGSYIQACTQVSGTQTCTSSGAITLTSGRLRLARSGTGATHTLYYWNGTTWAQLRQITNGSTLAATAIYITTYVQQTANITITAEIDNYQEINTPMWTRTTAGKFSNALSFDGTDDYAQINDNAPPLDTNYNTTDVNYIADGYAVSDPAKIEFTGTAVRFENQATLAEISAPQANLQGLWHLNELGTSIATKGAIDWESFTIGTDTYLAVANHCQGTCAAASDRAINSEIYKWMPSNNCFGNGTTCGTSIQSIGTKSAFDWESFTIGANTYLAVANYYSGSPVSYQTDSYIYKWNPSGNGGVGCFGSSAGVCANTTLGANNFQAIRTAGGIGWKSFMIGTDIYLAAANAYSGSSYQTDSYIYKWNPSGNGGVGCFGSSAGVCANTTLGANNFQAIRTTGAYYWESFIIGTDTYMAVANVYSGSSYQTDSYIYKWNPSGNGGVGCFGSSAGVCANTTLGANNFQAIRTAGGIGWKSFMIGTDTYLAVANEYSGTAYNTTSYIYKWSSANSCFGSSAGVCANTTLGANNFQAIGTAGILDWESFTISSDIYLAAANMCNSTGSSCTTGYNTNSYIYKWSFTNSCFGSSAGVCANTTLGANNFQGIETNGNYDWESFTIGADAYLAVANYYNNSTRNLNSTVYKWNVVAGNFMNAADSSANNNNGVYANGPTQTTAGRFPNSLSFSGSNYVNAGTNSVLDFTSGDFTFEAWIYPTNVTGWKGILGKYNGSTGGYVFALNGGQPAFWRNGVWYYGTAGSVVAAQWQHIAVKLASGSVTFYVNGIAQTPVPAGSPLISTAQFQIGAGGSNWSPFNGSIDEVAVWNTALNAQTIAQHAGIDYIPASGATVTGPNKSVPGLAGYASFAETATKPANTSIDYQLSNNDGAGWCYYFGGWVCDGAGYSDAATISANISTFSTVNSQIKVRARLNTTDATVRPELDNVSIGYLSPSAPLRLGSEQTIEAWVNVTGLGADWDRLIGKGVPGKENYGLWLQSDGDLKYQISNGATVCSAWVDGGTAKITAGSGWRHIVGTRTGNTMKLYLDGAEKASGTCLAVPSVSADPLIMGYDSGITGGDYFNGKIDEAAIYNAALPATGAGSIQEHYLRGIAEDYKTVEASGVVAANDGTTYGPITKAGKAGLNDALSFDGADDYVSVGDSTSLRISNYTVEVWIKPNGVPNETWKGIIGKPGRNFNIWLNSAGYIHHRFHNSASTNGGAPNTPNGSIVWDAWNHVAITNDGTTAKTYINGVEQASGSSGGAQIIDNTPLYIGSNLDGGNGNYFNGSIDEVAVWNTALDAAIIEQHAAFDYSAASGATVINKFSVPTDLGQITKWLSFSDVKTTFSNDSVEYQISNNYSDDGNDTNDTWCNYNTGTSSWQCSNANSVFSTAAAIDTGLKAGGFEVGNGMTVKARLNASSDGKYAPVLDAVEVGYPLSGYYRLISSSYNSNNPKNQIAKIQWLEDLPGPAGVSNIFVQIRSAPDNGGTPGAWTSFLGPKTTTFSSGGCPASCPSVMTAADASGFSANQRVILTDASGSLEEIKTIQSVSGNDITLTSPLKNNYSAGSLLSAFYDDPYGGELINSVYTDDADDQWFQYRVILNTSDTSYSPTFSSIRIQYEP